MSLSVTLFCTLVTSYSGVVGRVGGCEEDNGSLQVFFGPRTVPDNLLLSYTLFYYHEDFRIKRFTLPFLNLKVSYTIRIKLTVLEQAENEHTLRFSRKITNPKLLSEKYQKRLTLSSFLYI